MLTNRRESSASDVVCLHGLGRSAAAWRGVGAGLERYGEVRAPDLPRGGVEGAIEAIAGVAAGAVLVGHSLSGVVALRLAAASPSPPAAVVLTGSFFPPARNGRSLAAALGDYGAHRIALAREQAGRGARPRPDRGTARGMRSLAGLGLRPERFHAIAAAVRAPVLVVHGRLDHHVPVDFAIAAAARHEAWTLRIVERGDHDLHVERPAEWLAVVGSWLDRVMARRAGRT